MSIHRKCTVQWNMLSQPGDCQDLLMVSIRQSYSRVRALNIDMPTYLVLSCWEQVFLMSSAAQDCTKVHRIARHCTRIHTITQDFTRLHRISQDCTEMHRSANNCTGLHKIAQGWKGLHRNEQDSTGLERFAQDCTGLHRISQDCTGLHRNGKECAIWPKMAQDCTRLHRVEQDCTELHRFAQDCTGALVYSILTRLSRRKGIFWVWVTCVHTSSKMPSCRKKPLHLSRWLIGYLHSIRTGHKGGMNVLVTRQRASVFWNQFPILFHAKCPVYSTVGVGVCCHQSCEG